MSETVFRFRMGCSAENSFISITCDGGPIYSEASKKMRRFVFADLSAEDIKDVFEELLFALDGFMHKEKSSEIRVVVACGFRDHFHKNMMKRVGDWMDELFEKHPSFTREETSAMMEIYISELGEEPEEGSDDIDKFSEVFAGIVSA